MCGFVGFVGGTDNQSEVLTKMMDRIVHRGPDMGGQFIDGRVALGFRRLSILDLTEAGAQPMANEDGSVVIVFNGEIYNFQELRSELEAKGYKFHPALPSTQQMPLQAPRSQAKHSRSRSVLTILSSISIISRCV